MGIFEEIDGTDWAALVSIGCIVLAGIAMFINPNMVAWLVGIAAGGVGIKAGSSMNGNYRPVKKRVLKKKE